MRYYLGLFFCFAAISTIISGAELEKGDHYELTGQKLALAPNAGGQTAYKLEAYHNHHAFYGFNNRNLIVGNLTLGGLGYAYRLYACGDSCFWRFFIQGGGGVSNAGLFGDLTWGAAIPILPIWLPIPAPRYVPELRIDITNQFFGTKTRIVSWSYPIWVGITEPF